MSRFLLLLCFTAVHVLGQEHITQRNGNIPSKIDTPLSSNAQSLDGRIQESTIASAEAVPASAIVSVNDSKIQRTTTNQQTSIQNATPHKFSSVSVDAVNTSVSKNDGSTDNQIGTQPIEETPVQFSMSSKEDLSSEPGKWIVNDGNKSCIIVQMSAMFNVSYVNSNRTQSNILFNIPIDNSTLVNGTCGDLEQELTLLWSSKNGTNGNLTLHFVKNKTNEQYSFHHLETVLPPGDFHDIKLNKSLILEHYPENIDAKLKNSYRCLKQQNLDLKLKGSNETHGYITVSNLQFEAFKTDNSTVFGLAKDCAFSTPDVVPIAVGCALAGLVIIVLFAYLIGRRRNENRNYFSV